MKFIRFTLIVAVLLTYAFAFNMSSDEQKKPAQPVDAKLTDRVTQIFQKSCATGGCHSGAYPKKKLNLEADKFVAAIVDQPSLQIDSLKLVDTKTPEKSYLLMKVKGSKGIVEAKMPVDAPPLKSEEIKAIEDWIVSLQKAAPKTGKAIKSEVKKKPTK